MMISIEELDTGYLISGKLKENDKLSRYGAEDKEGAIRIIRRMLGMPEEKEITNSPPVAVTSHNRRTQEEGMTIPRFSYDIKLRKPIPEYKNTWYAELPDGRVALGYGQVTYYTTKEKVMQIPFPIKYGCLSNSGLSSTAQTCLRAYRGLIESRERGSSSDQSKANKPSGSEEGACDDITFDACANNTPDSCKHCVNESRFEDKRKLEAKKPPRPELKATIGL